MKRANVLGLVILSWCTAALAQNTGSAPPNVSDSPASSSANSPCPSGCTTPPDPECVHHDPKWQAYSPRQRCHANHDTFTLDEGKDPVYYEGSWACQTSNCTDLQHCIIENASDSQAYACQSWKAGRTCVAALTAPVPRLDDRDKMRVRNFFWHVDKSADCFEMGEWQKSWTSTAVYVSKGYAGPGWVWRHGIKILPTVSVGVPLVRGGDEDARRALRGLSTLGGLTIRYSPVSFLVSVHGFVGTSTVSTEDLNRDIYKAPALVVGGFGADIADGLFGVSLLWGNIRANGLGDDPRGTARTLQMTIDLTSAVLSVVRNRTANAVVTA